MYNLERFKPFLLQRLQEAAASLARAAEHLLPAEMGDGGMPQLQQMDGRGIAAFDIVDGNRVGIIALLLIIDQHIGNTPALQLHEIIVFLHRR
ncbi:hypothetical protein D3C72_2092740 [compost metagenome]